MNPSSTFWSDFSVVNVFVNLIRSLVVTRLLPDKPSRRKVYLPCRLRSGDSSAHEPYKRFVVPSVTSVTFTLTTST